MRSLPRMSGRSTLDINARRIRDISASRIRDGATRLAATGVTTAAAQARQARQVTWLADMLTPDRNSFGVLRLAMALLVLVSHAVFLTTGKVELEPLTRWTGYSLGQHGVQVFFILSGILVAQSLFQSRSVQDYGLARALRIFPALGVCVLLTALILGPMVTALTAPTYLADKLTASYIVKTLSLSTGSAELPMVFANNPVSGAVNTSVWTLKYEVLCYVILALVGLVLLRLKAWRSTVAALAGIWLLLALVVPSGISAADGNRSMLQVLHYFSIFFGTGVLAYAARRWIPVHAAVLLPLGALLWMAIGTRVAVPVMALSLGYAAIWLSTFRFGPLRAYTNANDYSYATYLYHYPVAQAVLSVAPAMHVVPLIGLTSGIVLPLAFVSWELIERPALALRKRIRPGASQMTPEDGASADAPTADAAPPTPPSQSPAAAVPDPHPARVWRPMPTRRTLSVMPDAPLMSRPVSVGLTEINDKPVTASALDAPKHQPKPMPRVIAARKPLTPTDAPELLPIAVISKSRMAMVTSRPAAPVSAPPEVTPPPAEPSRAVVSIDDVGPLSRRVAPPRPNWQIPTAQPG